MNKITQTFRNLKRFLQISIVFFNLLVDMFLQRIYFPEDGRKTSRFRRFWGKFFAFIFRRDVKKVDYPVIFREALERLGPTFIKLGQVLSLRKDFVPEELCKELEKLQDEVPPISFKEVVRVVELEFREPLYKVFPEFERECMASASLSQTHIAYDENNNKYAVKIQRPSIRRIVLNDINILKTLAGILEKLIPPLRLYQLKMFVGEFESYTLRELDFLVEGFHADKFSSNFENVPEVNFPKIYWDKTTTKVLTMEFIDGIKPKDRKSLEEFGIDRYRMAEIAANAVLKMLFIDGFFHGDPHPGNILITRDHRIYFIDLGMIGTFSEVTKNYMFLYYYYMSLEDYDNAVKNFIHLLRITPESDLEGFKKEMIALISKFSNSRLEDVSLAYIILDTLQIGVNYKVYFPGDTFLMSKCLVTIESIGTMLIPDLQLNKLTEPYSQKIFIEKFGFDSIVQGFARSAPDIIEFLRNLPQFTINTFKRLESGTQNINILPQPDKDKEERKNTSILSKSILIGVFSICGTIFVDYFLKYPDSSIVTSALNIFGQDIPVFGGIFYGLALILALTLIFDKKNK
ncbi:MAG: ABC1 kinase family protein [Spirochaetota bacterium]